MLNLRKISKSVGGRILFEDASLTINYSDFVALVGPNGAGKSTLFNIILSKDSADTGNVQRDEWTTVGFLPQEGEALGNETVIEIATGKAGRNCNSFKEYRTCFLLFTRDFIFLPFLPVAIVWQLSGN